MTPYRTSSAPLVPVTPTPAPKSWWVRCWEFVFAPSWAFELPTQSYEPAPNHDADLVRALEALVKALQDQRDSLERLRTTFENEIELAQRTGDE